MSRKKVAVVTGGTRGIGRAISLRLARSGFRVFAIHARNREAGELLAEQATAGGLEILCLRTDLTKDDALAECVNRIRDETDQVHVLVHSAANGVHRPAMELTAKHIRWTLDVNVIAIHRLVTEIVPMMQSGGRIVAITSCGATHALPYYAALGSSKGALNALFRHYACELAPRGITVNLICPGLVCTRSVEAFPDKEERLRTTILRTPTGRLTTPDEVAQLVIFVCSDAAAQVVGQTIVMDGGRELSLLT